jgi:hypothetical protein
MDYWVTNAFGQPVPCTLMGRINTRYSTDRVALTVITGRPVIEVSTVMLGTDHGFGMGGPPILFETMIFGGEHDEYQERYSTRAEAESGHSKALGLARKKGVTAEQVKPVTADDIRQLVEGVRLIAHDDEAAHQEKDELRRFVLQTIADGHDDPAALAREALATAEIDFSRWRA